MPSIGFSKQFVPAVEAGLRGEQDGKLHTIRARRKHRIKVGDTLFLYYALRTKQCRKLGERPCVKTEEITINPDTYQVRIGGRLLTAAEISGLATADGFKSDAEFWEWFRAGVEAGKEEFVGDIIHWTPNT